MNKDSFLLLTNWLKKHNINMISYDLFNQFEVSILNYNKLFEKLNISTGFSLFYIDNYMKNNKNILKNYKENIIFQYIYLILSSYTFENKVTLINAFYTIHNYILTGDYELLDDFLNSLPKSQTIDLEFYNVIWKVNKFINSSKYVSYIEKHLNSEKNWGNLCYSNIFETHSVITSTLKMLFVHNGNIDLDDFFKSIKNMSIDNFSIKLLIQKSNNSKLKFFEYMLNYYNNRFFYHGTNSKWLNNVKKFGLNGVHNFDYQNDILKAMNLFEGYGVYKIFEGKNKIEFFNYYVTDSIGSAVYYAHQAPEYLSRFCSNGDCMKLLQNYDNESFWRRDFDTCLNNVRNLCQSLNMNDNDVSFIISLFNKLWNKEVSKNQIPIIFVGRMKIIENNTNNFCEIRKNINNYSFYDIYSMFTNPTNIHNRRYATINKEYLNIIKLPNLYQLYHLKKSVFSEKKYVMVEGVKYYPDIVIKNDYFKDVFLILNNSDKIKEVTKSLYMIPKNIEELEKNKKLFYNQKLEYLLQTNAISLTSNGRQYLSKNIKDLKNVYNYYLNLTKTLLESYSYTDDKDKIDLYSIIANYVFYNLYIIKKTGKLPCFVDYGYKSMLHYDYDKDNYWYRSNSQNNISIDKLDSIIKTIKQIVSDLQEK